MDKFTCIVSALSKIYCAEGMLEEMKGRRKNTIIIESNPEEASADTAKNTHFLQNKKLLSIIFFCISSIKH
ncbi:hypothetical protein [Wolbachia endosymbiont of Chironomus riparius]|uniref:hypothetical protein n=1 Tax=Wolbachia endosymbiont of Chironomus riparius TaxID=2883238 RepID=UPI0020A0504B|nr:hypothetical protein [Wolbachia endosymbiont of Chironomus riparius]